MPPTLVDSHCHLDFPDFAEEIDDVVARACAAGVTRMVSIATSMAGEPRVRAIAETHAPVFYAAGLHPLHVHEESPPTVEKLVEIARHPKMVGIGETGLDYHYSVETRAVQQESLRLHCEAARRTGLPLIIHSRDADADMTRILTEEHAAGAFSCVMHCFSSSAELGRAMLDLGFYLSMSGIATFRKSTDLREIFASAPLDRILVETDSPYLAPQPKRGKRNEPAYTAMTAVTGAEVFGISVEDFAAATTANFDRLFAKAAAWTAEDAA
ncbi:TatD DNase family protein [Albimonas donghaensis]|uniref:TatD DNase family protein n=1 Tax=Albimonas donghaensis TaxID=356660 RepID=A0A1H2TKK1_9RHOB|nr:TatD family hydrolase [Albimonas donghaensis]SDW43804.1 TatD DNase family protein [Albimonas donghaensis]